MSPRTGRPTKNPRNISLTLRISQEEADILQYCADKMGMKRIDVIVKGIRLVESEVNKKG